VLEANFKGHGTLSATLLSLLRDAIACPVLYAYSRTCEGPIMWPHREDLPTFLCLGILLGGFQLCLTTGVSLTNSDTAALFQSLEPTTATILATSLGFERCSWRKVAAALLAGAGVVVLQFKFSGGISNPGGESRGEFKYLAGCGLFLLNGILISTYTLIQKSLIDPQRWRARSCFAVLLSSASSAAKEDDEVAPATTAPPVIVARRKYKPINVTAHAFFISFLVMIVASLVSTVCHLESPEPFSRGGLAAIVSWRSFISIFYSSILSSVLSFTLRASANVVVDVTMLILYNATQAPLTAVIAYVVFRDPYGPQIAVATVLTVSAVLLATRDHRKKTPSHSDSSGSSALPPASAEA